MFYEYADSGSWTESTYRSNETDFQDIKLRQRVAVDITDRSVKTEMVGQAVSMPVALAKGLVKTKGPLPKVLKLLPLLKPAYEMYPEHAKAHGLSIEKE